MIAVRPTEYWPRPAYFALMDHVDHFVLADTFQYSRQSYQNRASLRTPNGRQWISIPLRGRQHGRPIHQVEIHGKHRWIRKHWRALTFNYRATPFFEYYEDQLRPVFDVEWEGLADLTSRTVEVTRDLLGITTILSRASALEGTPGTPGTRGTPGIPDTPASPSTLEEILATVGDENLVVPEIASSVDGTFAASVLDFEEAERRQNFEGFEPGMSALDLLFNYGPEALSMIREQALIHSAPRVP